LSQAGGVGDMAEQAMPWIDAAHGSPSKPGLSKPHHGIDQSHSLSNPHRPAPALRNSNWKLVYKRQAAKIMLMITANATVMCVTTQPQGSAGAALR
jgi:hypothetical protein